MKFVAREPGVGYVDNWLWLPRSRVSHNQLRSALTYYDLRKDQPVVVLEDEPHHFRVPRNYFPATLFGKLPYPVVDLRPHISFPRVDLHSRVVLDAREQGKTYQRDGCAALLSCYDGILCLRCGAGKTVVALHTASLLKVPILVVVDDKSLAIQWMEEIEEFLGVPRQDIGRVGGDGSHFDWERPITVALIQTLAGRAVEGRLPPEFLRHPGVLLLDEAHVVGAPHFSKALPPFWGRRWGLSATPHREDGFDSLLRYTIGPVVYTYLQPDLKPLVYFRGLPTQLNLSDPAVRREVFDKSNKFHGGKTYGYLARNDAKRTAHIAKDIQDALDTGRQILVLTHSRDMCEKLGELFPQAGVCHGGVAETERRRRIRECNPVIAIMKIGKQALNKPILDTLFIVEPFAKGGILQQTLGRVLRAFANKKKPVVMIFEDLNIPAFSRMCGNLRLMMTKWPAHKGGMIPYKLTKVKE